MSHLSGRGVARALALPALALPLLLAQHGASNAQGAVKATYGDWEMRCEQQAAQEQCILYQNLADESRPDINLVIVVLNVADGEAAGTPRRPVLRVIAPLGVLLPRGLGLRIESATEKNAQGQPAVKDIGSTGFVKCVPSGCVAEVEMDETLVGEFGKGRTATFIIFHTPNEGRGLPLNLAGFAEGIKALK
jgi:invasion protein IalB